MRIAFVIASLSCGGAEKNVTMLANLWSQDGDDITIVKMDSKTTVPFFDLRPEVTVRSLNSYKYSGNIISATVNNTMRLFRLRYALEKARPDVVVSFMNQTNILTVLASIHLNLPVVISERNDPNLVPMDFFWSALRRLTYPLAHRIVVQTKGFLRFYPDRWLHKIAIIPNPVPPVTPTPQNGDRGIPKKPFILAMGKLKPQKGFDILLEAFSIVRAEIPDWTLVIFGEGEDRDRLRRLTSQYHLEDSVFMPGMTATPAFYMQNAGMFVLSSRYEGFPNVLCEAMAAGLPIVATDCSPSIGELVTDHFDGIVVERQADQLAHAIAELAANPRLRERLGANAARITDRYRIETIAKQWKILFPPGFQS